MDQLAVLALSSSPPVSQLHLQDCPALRALLLRSCSSLHQLDLGSLTRLEQLKIVDCQQLHRVVGVTCLVALTSLEVAGCSQLSQDLDKEGAAAQEAVHSLSKPAQVGAATNE
jgi:hypothetical protein